MIRIWTDGAEAGALDRLGERGSAFVYTPGAVEARAVSVTMPVRLPSWDTNFGLAPIFEMNLPEGMLRERLRLAFAKATGRFDDIDLLGVVGRSQLGRIRYTGMSETPADEVPLQSVDEILASRRGGDLYRYLIERFAASSGVSGVQPKVLVRDPVAAGRSAGLGLRGPQPSASTSGTRGEAALGPAPINAATHIVKFWEENEYPQLAANEYFCLRAAQRCGLEVAPFRLSEDGLALVTERFDLRPDGSYRGFEDFCVLNARGTAEKYRGSYETAVLKRFTQFGGIKRQTEELERLFTLIALNCALRNGDAHLKNFAILYDEVWGAAQLAPAYDLVSTGVYLPQDRMALTIDGSAEWPESKRLRRLGEVRLGAAPARVRRMFERIGDALAETAPEVEAYGREHPAFAAVGRAMLEQWAAGRRHSLGVN